MSHPEPNYYAAWLRLYVLVIACVSAVGEFQQPKNRVFPLHPNYGLLKFYEGGELQAIGAL